MAVDRGAQVVHDPLADGVRVESLGDAERARRERDPDHPGDEAGEQRRVLLGDGLVEHRAEQERGDHPEPGGDQDQAEDRAQAGPVGPEKSEQAAAIQAELVGVAVQHCFDRGPQPRIPQECAASRRR